MKLQRISAIIERDMRKFFRSPALMMSSMIFPLMQLIVLGYAFGGKIKGIKVAVVDQDHSAASRNVRQRFDAIEAGPQTLEIEDYRSMSDAIVDLAHRLRPCRRVHSTRITRGAWTRKPAAHRVYRGQHRQFCDQ